MVPKKRKSKRQTLQSKFRIVKRTKEHKKRLKKGAITNFKPKAKPENRIPNAWPYKEDLLREIRTAKDKMEELKQRQKEKRKEEVAKRRASKNGSNSMDTDADEYEDVDDDEEEEKRPLLNVPANPMDHEEMQGDFDSSFEMKTTNVGQNSRRAFLKELRKVVDSADVILHVLDARDPVGTRSSTIEDMVLSASNKRLVLVLNKADLVPREVLVEWLTYLRQSHPTLPFKCNTQAQKGNLGMMSGKVGQQQESALKSNQAVGTEELIGLLKNYARVGDSKTIITVGCVGFPNVGKSSLINSLLRSRAVGVSSTPGFTKQSQEVILDKNIRLIDSPGVVFADGDSAATTLRNCVNVETIEDVIPPVQAILEKCPPSYLMQLYSIPKFESGDVNGFLALVARGSGKLKKGGIPNLAAAAKAVLHDWNDGKIKFYVKPPAHTASTQVRGDLQVVDEYSSEMDLANLGDADIRVLNSLEAAGDSEGGVGGSAFVAFSDYDMHFGDPTKDEKLASAAIDTVKAKSTIVKLSKKAIAATKSDSGRPPRLTGDQRSAMSEAMSESRSVAGTLLSSASVGGVLSRRYDEPELDSEDVRKVQKQAKKKAVKAARRESKGDVVMDTNESAADYDFSSDFKY